MSESVSYVESVEALTQSRIGTLPGESQSVGFWAEYLIYAEHVECVDEVRAGVSARVGNAHEKSYGNCAGSGNLEVQDIPCNIRGSGKVVYTR